MSDVVKTLVVLSLIILLTKKTYSMNSSGNENVSSALLEIANKYGAERAKRIEQIIRLETAHFNSIQWKKGNTAGMEVGNDKKVFPFGWSSLAEFVELNGLNPSNFSTYTMVENRTGKIKRFIKFPSSFDFILFLAFLMKKRGWDYGSWYSRNKESKERYIETLNRITPKIVNSFVL